MDLSEAGVGDAVLLENYQNEDVFIDNLEKRFKEDIIYSYIGNVAVSVNPYKNIPIYTNEILSNYRSRELFENKPHVFAIADSAYRHMHEENEDQCVLISGESGAGKTEASKKILQYIAAVSTHTKEVEIVRDRLLESNPVLEAFGNAKTVRNDNSSRFGKYMDIQFDYKGAPIGGHIINYLLEKSRVVHQSQGERNFHIFYQLIFGAEDALLETLKLERDVSKYTYLKTSAAKSYRGIDDVGDFNHIQKALATLGFAKIESINLYSIISGILHLGNVEYQETDADHAEIATDDTVKLISELLQVDLDELRSSLTHRSIITNGQRMTTPLNKEQAYYARDALAKSLYDRMFTWLVGRLNDSLSFSEEMYDGRKSLLGVLDIYGFEVFEENSFEQFCINYCNEKLQQLFIELTLKSEQDEYKREGIEWTPVEYFDNRVICQLIEEKHKGIISLLDEECTRPGTVTDATFLEKMNASIGKHAHYESRATNGVGKSNTISRSDFILKHYAGDVTYTTDGFLDKNNDLLYRDMKEVMSKSASDLVDEMFPDAELESKKRPPTAGTQFKASLNNLINILESKEPSYIRCIKPNDTKSSGKFDLELVRHQVRYLGLMENLRVRRAGFAFRRIYDKFLERYKVVCPETWPNWKGERKDGVAKIFNSLDIPNLENEVRYGTTKVFVRSPKFLYGLEVNYHAAVLRITIKLQAKLKGWIYRQRFLKQRSAQIMIAKHLRAVLARNGLVERKEAVVTLRKLINGFNGQSSADTEYYLSFARQSFIKQAKASLQHEVPTCRNWVADTSVPTSLLPASHRLRDIHCAQVARKFDSQFTDVEHVAMQEKILASTIFKDKKTNYKDSIKDLFQPSRDFDEHPKKNVFMTKIIGKPDSTDKEVVYATPVDKLHRANYKLAPRFLVAGTAHLFVLDQKSLKEVTVLDYGFINGISVSKESDGMLVIKTAADKGDYVLHVGEHIIECATKLAKALGGADKVEVTDTLQHTLKKSNSTKNITTTKPGEKFEVIKSSDGCTVTGV